MWESLARVNAVVGGVVWGPVGLALLFGTGCLLTVRTGFFQLRYFGYWMRHTIGAIFLDRNVTAHTDDEAISQFQSLCTALAATIGTGNIVGVAAAILAGGPGAVFWMWVTALIGSSTAFIEATLAQLYKEKDPLYGGYRGGPAYYIHAYVEEKQKKKRNKVVISVLFAISGLICWCGISQVISNSVVSSFKNAFSIPPIYTTVVLVAVAAVIVLRKNAPVKVLDMIVPIMAVVYFAITILIIVMNIGSLPGVFARIFQEAFGFRQVAAGGFGAVLMNGIKRGLFSNESGMGSAPIAAAAAQTRNPVRQALVSSTGTFWDTVVVCLMTGLVLVTTIMKNPNINADEVSDGGVLTSLAFGQIPVLGPLILTLGIICFAYSTILGWAYYGERCVEYFAGRFGKGVLIGYRLLYVAVAAIAPVVALDLIWLIADTLNAFMAVPNLIAVLLLSNVIVKETKEYINDLDKKDETPIPVIKTKSGSVN